MSYDSEDAYSDNSQAQAQDPAQGQPSALSQQMQQAQTSQQMNDAPVPDSVQAPVQMDDTSQPNPAALANQPQPMVRFQRTVGNTLRGMLMGLAQGGIPGAVVGAASPTSVQRNADQAQQAQALKFKFASAQAAAMAADASMKAKQVDNYDADHQQAVFKNNQETADWFMNHGYTPTSVTANDGHSEMAAMKGMGTIPPVTSLQVAPGQIMHFDLSQMPQQVGLDAVNQLNTQLGKPQISSAVWAAQPQQMKMQQIYNASQYWSPAASQDAVLQYKNDRARIAAIPDAQLPDKAATLAKYDSLIKNMQTSLDANHQHDEGQKVSDFNAETPGIVRRAGGVAYAQAAAKQKAMDVSGQDDSGQWNPASVPVSLVEGTMDPSQLSKRSSDYNAKLEAANRYSIAKYGHPFDIAQAQTDYRYANQRGTQDALKYVQSIVAPKGELDIVQNTAQMLPRHDSQFVNSLINTTKTQFGSPAESNFHAAVLSFADTYAKVMGSGQPTDAGRQQGLDLLKSAFSTGQIGGAMNVLRQDVAARQSGIIGNNRYLQKQFGQAPQQTYKVGDPIVQNGQTFTVTSVDANGKVTGAR